MVKPSDVQARREARDFAATQTDILRRLEALERSGSLSRSSIEGGSLTVNDEDGNPVVVIGDQGDGTTGVGEFNGPIPPKPSPPMVTTRNGLAFVTYRTSQRLNYVTDPSFENSTGGWSGENGAVVALSSGNVSHGSYTMGIRWQTGSRVERSLADLGLTPGEFYTVSLDVARGVYGHVEMRVSGDEDVATTRSGDRLSITFRVGDAAPTVTLTPEAAAPNDQAWVDRWAVVPGTAASDYFDGSMTGYQWLGTPGDSQSVAVETLPPDVAYVKVHADTDAGFTPDDPTFYGSILPGGGPLSVPLPVGLLFYVKVVVVTRSGQQSPPSDPTPVRVRPIGILDIGQGAVTGDAIAAGALQESHLGFSIDVGGGVIATYGPEPHGNPGVNDMWWDSNNGYRPSHWDGDSWEPMQFGEAALSAESVTARQILAGAVTAGAIAAGAISAEKLSIGAVAAGSSRLLNHNFEATDPDTGVPTRWTLRREAGGDAGSGYTSPPPSPITGEQSLWVTMSTPAATARIVHDSSIPVRGGETWALTAQIKADRLVDNPQAVTLIAQTSDLPDQVDSVDTVGTVWQTVAAAAPGPTVTEITGQFDIPADAKYLTVSIRVGPGDAFGPYTVGLDQVVLQPVVSSVQIANGAIRAEQIAADAIRSEHIESGTISGTEIAGQVIMSTTFLTPDTDAAGNLIPYSTLSVEGYEGRDSQRRTKHKLSNNDEASYYSGDADITSLRVTESAQFDADVQVGRGKRIRLSAKTEPPGGALGLSNDYATIALDTTTVRSQNTGSVTGAARVLVIRPHAFNAATAVYMTTKADDGRFCVITYANTNSRVWTFNADGSIFATKDYPWWRLTGYANDGTNEIFIGYYVPSSTWYSWDTRTDELKEVTNPGLTDPTITQQYADTVPGGATLRRFHILRLRATGWESRQVSVETTDDNLVVYGTPVTLDIAIARPFAGVAIGRFDYGDTTTRFATAALGTDNPCRTFDTTTGAQPSTGLEAWPSAVSNRRGFTYNRTIGAFFDLADDGTLYRYSPNKWTVEPPEWWFAATYQDPNVSGTIHETNLGPKRRIRLRKRANVRVSTPAIPTFTTPGPDDPTRWALYAVRTTTATEPASTLFRLQGVGVAPAVVLAGVTTTGVAPPAVNQFPDKDPAEHVSSALWADGTPQVMLRGDGFQNILPPGALVYWGGPTSTIPKGFEVCDGRTVPRTGDYARLFAAWGVLHGPGDGATTFTMLDTRGRSLIGVSGIVGEVATAAGKVEALPTDETMQQRVERWRHAHTHTVSGQSYPTGVGYASGGAGEATARAAFDGHAHGGATGSSSGLLVGVVHPYAGAYVIAKL